jgi:hypothetical protein
MSAVNARLARSVSACFGFKAFPVVDSMFGFLTLFVNECTRKQTLYEKNHAMLRCKMAPQGYVEYKRREFCKDVKCSNQLELAKQQEGSAEYEKTRQKCGLYTTWQFHNWLNEKRYLIVNQKKNRKG